MKYLWMRVNSSGDLEIFQMLYMFYEEPNDHLKRLFIAYFYEEDMPEIEDEREGR